MNDPFDVLERELVAAAGRAHRHPVAWRVRWPRRTPRGRVLAVFIALCLGSATAALAAAGVFQAGTPVGPGAPVIATAGNGTAIASATRLMASRAPDPAGGLPWGVKVIHTTRDETCIQVGRVDYGTVGVLGQDGAFSNDGRFHPLSRNYEGPLNCDAADANGNAFINDIDNDIPASGYNRGCRLSTKTLLAGLPPQAPAAVRRALTKTRARVPVCPTRDLRNVYFGLLGPDAVSVTYATPTGQLHSTPTTGPDGAYVIVLPHIGGSALCSPHRPVCPRDEMGEGNGIWADGVIRAVHYRDGRACSRSGVPLGQLQQCPNVGYVAVRKQQPTSAQVSAPITIATYEATFGHERQRQVKISFVSRVAVTNSSTYYYIELDNPSPEAPGEPSRCDPYTAADGTTDSDYRAGQRVTMTLPVAPCRGLANGTVTLVSNGDFVDHLPGGPGSHRFVVGTFNVNTR